MLMFVFYVWSLGRIYQEIGEPFLNLGFEVNYIHILHDYIYTSVRRGTLSSCNSLEMVDCSLYFLNLSMMLVLVDVGWVEGGGGSGLLINNNRVKLFINYFLPIEE